ncbi:MAG: neutral zinc metallopeptidase [Croceibacterium sp.]
MRLNPFNPGSINVRGGGGGFPGGGGGQLGCGAIVIALIGALVFGIDPSQMLGGLQDVQQAGPAQPADSRSVQQICTQSQYATDACNTLQSLNDTWAPIFQKANIKFQPPALDLYSGSDRSGCGAASSGMGPFYCPNDQTIYLDTSFYDELDKKLGAGPGDFARYYVIAHEYGHHVQALTGVAQQISSAQQQNPGEANQLSVLMELQADCYAGVWAGKNRNLIEPGDFEEGMKAAQAIGDDTLTHGSVSSENFTHGSSQQRMQALRMGMESADDAQCDKIVQRN